MRQLKARAAAAMRAAGFILFVGLILLLVHEGAHWLTAQALVIPVEEIWLGVGPEWKHFEGTTPISVRRYPVSVALRVDAPELFPAHEIGGMAFAGPLANALFGLLIFCLLYGKREGTKQFVTLLADIGKAFAQIFKGKFLLSGPLSIASELDRCWSQGWRRFADATASLSIAVAVLNVIPFLTLDGTVLLDLAGRRVWGTALKEQPLRDYVSAGVAALFAAVLCIDAVQFYRKRSTPDEERT